MSLCCALGVPIIGVVQPMKGKFGGTYGKKEVADRYWAYLAKQGKVVNFTEKGVQEALHQRIPLSQREVVTPAGIIDILSVDEIIEVKHWKNWKDAIGQVLVYGLYYPSHAKRIHLFGVAHLSFAEMVEANAEKLDISVTWE